MDNKTEEWVPHIEISKSEAKKAMENIEGNFRHAYDDHDKPYKDVWKCGYDACERKWWRIVLLFLLTVILVSNLFWL